MPPQSDPTHIPPAKLYNLLLRVLRESGGTASAREQLEFIAQHTDFVGDVQKLRHRLAWIRTSLKGLGLIRSTGRGMWQLTELGYHAPDLDVLPTPTPTPRMAHLLSPYRVRSSADRIELLLYLETATDADVEVQPLTADYLRNAVVPLIAAFDDIQQLLSLEWDLNLPPLALMGLSRTNPTISLEGAAELVEGVLKHTVPWRKQNFKRLEELKIAKQEVEIEKGMAEEKEIEARVAESEERRKNLEAAAAERRSRANSIDMDCRLKQLEVDRGRWRLLMDMVNDIKPNATEEEKIALARKLSAPIETITESELTPKVIKITEGKITKDLVGKG